MKKSTIRYYVNPLKNPFLRKSIKQGSGILKLVVILFWLLCCHCKKHVENKYVLPDATQEGKNTFGCKVNDNVWVPYWPCNRLGAGSVEMLYSIYPSSDTSSLPIVFTLHVGNFENGESIFSFQQAPTLNDHLIYQTGNIIDSLQIMYLDAPANTYYNYYHPSIFSQRYFNITKLDTINKIISGTFAFTLYGQNGLSGTDSVVITEGRFDLKIGQFGACTQ
jgi:hypothetical protein